MDSAFLLGILTSSYPLCPRWDENRRRMILSHHRLSQTERLSAVCWATPLRNFSSRNRRSHTAGAKYLNPINGCWMMLLVSDFKLPYQCFQIRLWLAQLFDHKFLIKISAIIRGKTNRNKSLVGLVSTEKFRPHSDHVAHLTSNFKWLWIRRIPKLWNCQ